MHECTGSAESGESVAKLTHSVARIKTLPRQPIDIQSKYTRSSTTGRISKSDTHSAATDEDIPKCDKCGLTFPWNQLHLRWKRKCEPIEVDNDLQRTMSSASRKLLPATNAEQLSASNSCTVEPGVRNEDSEPQVCRCGKTFADNELGKFMMHTLQCPKGTPIHPPGAQGATL